MKNSINIKIAVELNQLMHKYYQEIQYEQAIKLIKVQMDLLEIAALEGDKDASYELALLYGESAFFRENPFYNENKYVYWLRKAIKIGYSEAKNNLASVYMTSDNKKYSNILKGLSLIKEAYLDGNEVGELSYNNCIKNLKKKNSTLRKSVEQFFKLYPEKKNKFLGENPDFEDALKKS